MIKYFATFISLVLVYSNIIATNSSSISQDYCTKIYLSDNVEV